MQVMMFVVGGQIIRVDIEDEDNQMKKIEPTV
jgi:hypothetical protein